MLADCIANTYIFSSAYSACKTSFCTTTFVNPLLLLPIHPFVQIFLRVSPD